MQASDNMYQGPSSYQYGFAKPEEARYRFRWLDGSGRTVGGQEFSGTSFSFALPADASGRAGLEIEAKYTGNSWTKSPLVVTLGRSSQDAPLAITGIDHGL